MIRSSAATRRRRARASMTTRKVLPSAARARTCAPGLTTAGWNWPNRPGSTLHPRMPTSWKAGIRGCRRPLAKPPSGADGSGPSALAHAWQLYRHGNYAAASKAFATLTASDDRQEALNARMGLAYSLIKQGRLDPSIAHLTHLVDQDYRPAETRLALTHALMQRGRWAEAGVQIAQLPPAKRAVMEKRLLEARLLQEYQSPGPRAPARRRYRSSWTPMPKHSPSVSGQMFFTASPNGWPRQTPRSRQQSCDAGSWIARCPRNCVRGSWPN